MSFKSKCVGAFYAATVAASISSAVMTIQDIEYKRLPAKPEASDIFLAFGKNFGRSIGWGIQQTGQFFKGLYESFSEAGDTSRPVVKAPAATGDRPPPKYDYYKDRQPAPKP